MQLGTRGRYALTALTYMARRGIVKKPIMLREIVESQAMPASYLEQIFARLVRARIVMSVRGREGGYTLVENPKNLSLARIFEAVGERVHLTRCHGKRERACGPEGRRCLAHQALVDAEKTLRVQLGEKVLAHVLENAQKDRFIEDQDMFQGAERPCTLIACEDDS